MKKLMVLGWALAASAALVSTGAGADGFNRAYSSELVLRTNYVEGKTLDGPNGSSLYIDDDLGFGIGFMYNKDSHWAIGGSFDWFDTDYKANGQPRDNGTDPAFNYKNRLESLSLNVDANYYFLTGNITPYVTGSLGWTWLDSNVADGPAYSYCWWNYWGYYCTVDVPTVRESGYNYKVGGGMMWQVTRYFTLRGSVSYTEVDVNVAGENPSSTIWRLEFASRM